MLRFLAATLKRVVERCSDGASTARFLGDRQRLACP